MWGGAVDDDGGFDGLADSFSGPVDIGGGFGSVTDDDNSFSGLGASFSSQADSFSGLS